MDYPQLTTADLDQLHQLEDGLNRISRLLDDEPFIFYNTGLTYDPRNAHQQRISGRRRQVFASQFGVAVLKK
jgi:hypothetical protein